MSTTILWDKLVMKWCVLCTGWYPVVLFDDFNCEIISVFIKKSLIFLGNTSITCLLG